MGGKVKKPYLSLRGRPVLSWTLERLGKTPGLQQIVLVTRPDDRPRATRAAQKAGLKKSIRLDFADGGARRMDSVFNGLKATAPDSGLVLIHDAARPFPPASAIKQALEAAQQGGASILSIPVRDTVKKETGSTPPACNLTVPRAGLWLAQTPQVFRRGKIIELFERWMRESPQEEATDDAAICERYGIPVALIESSATNLKITRPEDLKIADAFLKNKILG
jgi:2-C-methyl-D-erythritol 4-phosphate cytidylyltransferase